MVKNNPITYVLGTEPKVGDIARGIDIGGKSLTKSIWVICEGCGKGRWVRYTERYKLCQVCAAGKRYSVLPITYVKGNIPKIGDISTWQDIGQKSRSKIIWVACNNCGNQRWVGYCARNKICRSCSQREKNKNKDFRFYTKGTVPKLGDVAYRKDIGQKSRGKIILVACDNCGKEWWVGYYNSHKYCRDCSRKIRGYDYLSKRGIVVTYKVGTEPKLGDIAKPSDLGRKGIAKYVWVACVSCGKESWVVYFRNNGHHLCHSCACKIHARSGSKNRRWRGGKTSSRGYIYITLDRNDPYYLMQGKNRGYVGEHRVVMARYLGRCLTEEEIVHHKNGDRTDNRIENLELSTHGAHAIEHNRGYKDGFSRGYKDGMNKKLKELEEKVALYESLLFVVRDMESRVG